ncbi:MAG: hypothetical protein ABSF95_17355 [Verrucomicrobiota bacterium]
MTLLQRAREEAVAAIRRLSALAAPLATAFLRRYRPDRRPCPAAYGR